MELSEYAKLLNFEEKDGVYLRVIRSFKVYLRKWKYLIYDIPSLYIVTDKEISNQELKRLEIAANKNACSLTGMRQKNTLIITLPIEKKKDENFKINVDNILERVTALLVHDGFAPANSCFFCNQHTDEYRMLGEDYIPFHKECFAPYYDKFIEKYNRHKETEKKRFILSLLLGIAAAIIGILPAILMTIFNHDYSDFLGVLVPILMIGSLFIIKPQVNRYLTISFTIISCLTFITFLSCSFNYLRGELDMFSYFFTASWKGFRHVLFSTLFSFSPIGLIRFYKNLLPDYEATKKLLDEQKGKE